MTSGMMAPTHGGAVIHVARIGPVVVVGFVSWPILLVVGEPR